MVLGFSSNTATKKTVIILATIIVGVLDALAAITVYGIFYKYNPVQIYQFVSSALLGNEAYSGGVPVALLGLCFHFLIAFVSSFLFIQFYPKLSILRSNRIIVGLCYGLIVWGFMNLIVIPLTKLPPSNFDIVAALAIAWHMLLVGLPISLLASSFYRQSNKF